MRTYRVRGNTHPDSCSVRIRRPETVRSSETGEAHGRTSGVAWLDLGYRDYPLARGSSSGVQATPIRLYSAFRGAVEPRRSSRVGKDLVAVSNRIRALWLVKALSPGGAENLLVSMARVMDRSRFDIEVGYLRPSPGGLVPSFTALDVPTHCLGCASEYDLRWAATLRRLLVAGSYDVVHSHSPYVSGISRLVVQTLPRNLRPALVSTEHSLWSKYSWPTRILNALSYGLDRHRFVVSDAVRRQIWQCLPRPGGAARSRHRHGRCTSPHTDDKHSGRARCRTRRALARHSREHAGRERLSPAVACRADFAR